MGSVRGFGHLRPITVHLSMGRNVGGYLLVGSACGSSVGSLSVTLSFRRDHHMRGGLGYALVLSSVLRSKALPGSLCGGITSLIHEGGVSHVVNVNHSLGRCKNTFSVRGRFCLAASRFVGSPSFGGFGSRLVLVGNSHRFRFRHVSRLLRGGIRRAVLRIGLSTIIRGFGCCHSGLGPRAGVIYVIGTFKCKTNSCRLTGALRRRHYSCLTITITSRKRRLHGRNVSVPLVIVGPRFDDFGILFRGRLRPRICDFHLLSTVVGRARHENVASCPVRVGVSAKVRHLNFRPRSMPRIYHHLGRRDNMMTHSMFSRLMNDSSCVFSSFAGGRLSAFAHITTRLRTKLRCGIVGRVLGSTKVRQFASCRVSVMHLNVNLCKIDTSNRGKLHGVDALGAAVLRVRGIPTNSSVNCDQVDCMGHSSHVTVVPVNCTSNLSHRFDGNNNRIIVGNRHYPVVNGVYVSTYVVSIASASTRRKSSIVVFNRRLPIDRLSSGLGAVPCRVLASVSPEMGEICCERWVSKNPVLSRA